MSDTNSNFERLSFWQLISKVNIEIPIIQRGYAQGREGQQKVRDKFLEALYNALTKEPKEPVELDFVYGSKTNRAFQPLDGQQRLTTLFLLHWYIATKENKTGDFKKQLEFPNEKSEIIGIKFNYKTRISSLEFCNELTVNRIVFGNLLPSDRDEEGKSKNNELSKTIKNSPWFVSSWEKDPTIAAMLIMLDAIHLNFKGTNKLWEKLIDEKEPFITFLNIILENFGLSDDLYIKMNARGKPLTEFENFKSQFEKYIESENTKFEKKITNPEEQFAHKIDTVWMDLFWQYREEQEDDSSDIDNEEEEDNSYNIDDKIINFISGVAINYYAEKQEISENVRKELSDKGKSNTDDAIKRERIEQRIQQLANNSTEIIPEDFPTTGAFQYLIDCFNKYSEKQNDEYKYSELKLVLPLWHYFNDSPFKDFIKFSKPEYKPRILFYAQTVYLLKGNNINEYFSDWMRVVRNIVENTTIEQPNAFISAVNLVQELSDGCQDIYTYLVNKGVSSRYAKEQVKEEVEKAKIIKANIKNKKIILKTEDTNFCKGKIDFALYCIDYDIDKKHNVSSFDPDKLEKIYNVLNEHLSEEDVTNDFRRAFFTIKNNDFYDYWPSYLHAVKSPKRAIITNVNDLKDYFATRGKDNCNISNNNIAYFKKLILQLSEKDIDTLINDYISTPDFTELPNWKKRIIKEKGLLDHSIKHYIAIKEDNSCCWLIPGSKVANDNNGRKKLKLIK
jgi:hypothetical protein